MHVGRHGDNTDGCHSDGSQEMGGNSNVSLQQQTDDLVTAINSNDHYDLLNNDCLILVRCAR